ncbi:hypothetical protein FS749_007729 [Ceratobasidium sp. UAMH 11750]|nr:hypothetical protein FS749_007729 [Ceratobasidium sp. UAMH 11750]
MSALLKPSCASSFQGILAVGQEASAGYAPLPGTVAELERLEKHAQAVPFMRLEGKAATAPAVLHNMGKYSWIHLACHASQNTSNPTASSFHLHDSQLDLATLAREPLEHAELAFLSACETAAGDEMLPDEAIHLAAGMLMIGYRTVIATMWSIKDEDAPIVTDQFYSELLEGGVPNTEKAAKALHDAVGRLRDRVGEKALARWAPFVHFGQ